LKNVRVSGFTASSQAANCYATANGPVCDTRLNEGIEQITFADLEPPVITVPGNIIVEAASVSGTVVDYTVTVFDAADANPTLDCSQESGSLFTLGNTVVSCTATDASGNVAEPAFFSVTVEDTTSPVIDVDNGGNPIVFTANGPEGAWVDLSDIVTASDLGVPIPVACVTTGIVLPELLPPGDYTVICTASDGSSVEVSVQITIDVVDIEPPVLTVPTTAFTAIADPDTGTKSVDYSASVSAFDNVDLDITIVCDPPSGSTFPIGDTTVSCTASDDGPNGDGIANTDTKEFTVTVNDETAPVITLTGEATITLEAGIDTYTEQGAVVSDVGDPLLTTVLVGGDVVHADTVGVYVVTYDATDASDNPAVQKTRTVTVSDSTPPVITLVGEANITLEAGIGTYTELGASVADKGDSTTTVITGGNTVVPSTVGIYVVTYDATDASGNLAVQVTRTVTVSDSTAPVITLIGAANITLEAGVDSYTEQGAAVSDVGDPLLTTVLVGGDTVDPNTVGTYVVTYNAIDASGISAGPVTRTVTVVDSTAPVITLLGVSPVTVEVGGTYTDAGATAADASDGDLTGSIATDDPVDTATVGSYTVTYDVTDSSTNAATQVTRIVNVTDTTAPVITASDVELRRDYFDIDDPDWARIAVAEYTSGVVANDVADGAITLISCDRDDDPDPLLATDFEFSDTPYGITCTAEDSAGNVGTGSFELTILYSYDINLIPPKGRARAGSTVPLDWQYLDKGALVDSSAVDVRVSWAKMTNSSCTVPDPGTPGSNGSSGLGDDSGFSDFRYSASNDTWQFSWQTPDATGYFKISVSPPGASVETGWACIRLR